MTERAQWRWFGHAGHLIVSAHCRFHLFTDVGDYLVSTVGEYWPPRSSREIHAEIYDPDWLAENRHRLGDDFDAAYMERFGFTSIGCERRYETMVFRSGGAGCGCGCGMPSPSDWTELDMAGYNDAPAATDGHMAMCEKYAAAVGMEVSS